MIRSRAFRPSTENRLPTWRAIFFAGCLSLRIGLVPALATDAAGIDPYDVLERFGKRDHLPRLISTEDVGMAAVRPEALQPVHGDFDADRRVDIAISGIYNLKGKLKPYFLLVVSDPLGTPKVFMQEESDVPLYLHKPGSTGPGDPGDQAFSITTCVNCTMGIDVRWDASSGALKKTPWPKERVHVKKLPTPLPVVSDDQADKALKIAGTLSDVQDYVTTMNEAGKKLGTRVEPAGRGSSNRVKVSVYEKLPDGEKLFDEILIDLASQRVIKRLRK